MTDTLKEEHKRVAQIVAETASCKDAPVPRWQRAIDVVSGLVPDRLYWPSPDELLIESKIKDPYNALTGAGRAADWIFIGDTNHTSCDTRFHLSEKPLLKMLAESGVSHLCIEFPIVYDAAFQDFQSDKITEDQLRTKLMSFELANRSTVTKSDFINSIINTVKNARGLGITVHAADPGANFFQTLADIDKQIINYLSTPANLENFSKKDQEIAKNLTEGLRAGKDENEIKEITKGISSKLYKNLAKNIIIPSLEKFIKERSQDEELAKNISAATNGEKFAVIYGTGHRDLFNHLGGNPLIIDIVNDRSWTNRYLEAHQIIDRNPPHAIINIKDNAAYITEAMPLELKEKLETKPEPAAVQTSTEVQARPEESNPAFKHQHSAFKHQHSAP
ncbi:MAG: hypothetical protein IT559_08155 [Alphaproteobacteria bacterium]|nr:hypothetical protein [Alphaproteobacteria bacterium]